MDYELSSEDHTSSDSFEFKTPRRSLRLKSNRTPAINKSTAKKIVSERKLARLSENKAETSEICLSSSVGKEGVENSLSSAEEKDKKILKVKGKKKKTRKSRKNAKSKSMRSPSVETDSDKNILNVTFNKSDSMNSESENNISQVSTSKVMPSNENLNEPKKESPSLPSTQNFVNCTPEINVSSNLEDHDEPSNTSKILLNIKSEDLIVNDESGNKNSAYSESPKTPLLKKKVEKLVSSTPIIKPITVTTPGNIKRLQSNNLGSASKSYSKKSVVNRISTPFHRSGRVEKKSTEPLKLIATSLAEIVTPVSAKEIIEKSNEKLRSIRKRSLSESGRNKKANHVTFHSPSNVEIRINDIDEVTQKTTSKETKQQEACIYVTQRRKRSLSVAETEIERKVAFDNMNLEAHEETGGTPSKQKRLPVPTSRTKMPNFAAIHQQKFHKMESIADHIARKAERAKALTSSTTKTAGPSTKGAQNNNDSKKQQETKVLTAINKSLNRSHTISKARQKIDLSHIGNNKKKIQLEKKIQPEKTISLDVSRVAKNNDFTVDKVKNRQQKNMELYKSRSQTSQKSQQSKRQEIVKGVRSNRRFELQMMCRNRTDP